jgi:OOP family OmpA-OmpF porin
MEKRILAVLIAAFAGTAAAQGYVTGGASGAVVKNGFGDCWTTGMSGAKSAACPPTAAGSTAAAAAPRTQLAQASTPADARVAQTPRRTSSAADAAGRTAAVRNPPPAPGYVGTSSAGVVATSPYGLCWHAGSDWTPDKAAAPCDAVPRASLAVPPVAAAPAPAPEPQPLAVAEPTPAPQPVVIEKVSLSTDVLFGFNKAQLTPAGEEKLEQLARDAQGANVEKVNLIGHADRIGSEEYNKELSEKRAQAVADFLAQRGVDSSRLQVEGRGESQPLTGSECQKLGKDSNKNQKLIACLQPDRRVDAELLGSRESTASSGSAPSATGSTGTSSSTGSAGSTGTSGSSSSSSQ